MSTETNNTTATEPTAEQIAAAKQTVTDKIAPFGGKPAEALEVMTAAFTSYPEKGTDEAKSLSEARSTLTAFAGMFPDIADAWVIFNGACKKPAAPRKPTATRKEDGGLTPAQAAKALQYIETGAKYTAAGMAMLRGETPEPIRNRPVKDEDPAAQDGGKEPDGEGNEGDENDGEEGGEVKLDSKSAEALGAAPAAPPAAPVANGNGRKAPPTPEELAAVGTGGKKSGKK